MTISTMFATLIAVIHGMGAAHKVSVKETSCLTEAIYQEARGEPARGQALVAGVILNRVAKSPTRSICRVIQAPGQFPWARHRKAPVLRADYIRSARMAVSVQVGTVSARTNATFFYNPHAARPSWARKAHLFRVGHHVFATPFSRG